MCLILGAAAVAATICTIAIGSGQYLISPLDALSTVFGTGNLDDLYIVNQVRLPRALAALVVGAFLGAAGAVFQTMSRNPLASPDLIGYNDGAATGAVLALLVLPDAAVPIPVGSLIGGALTALAVYGLSRRNGTTGGGRLILIGIGFTALVKSASAYLLTTVGLDEARAAQVWLFGSLNGMTWTATLPALAAAIVLIPLALLTERPLRALEMGDELARGLGLSPERARLRSSCVAVGLTAAAIATAGPIAFVALAAPQIARRLTRSAGPGVLPAALLGSVLLTTTDLLGQQLFAPIPIPVGILTGLLGGIYLVVTIVWARRGR